MSLVGKFSVSARTVGAIESGVAYQSSLVSSGISIPTIGLNQLYSIEADPEYDVVIFDILRTIAITSANGYFSSSIEMFLSNSLVSGGFTIVPATGVIQGASNLNGYKINQVPKFILKEGPTVNNLPATPNFGFNIQIQEKTSSGNTSTSTGQENNFFGMGQYIIIPAGQSAILNRKYNNLEGSAFNIDSFVRLFLIERKK